jgi:hypothetical protein
LRVLVQEALQSAEMVEMPMAHDQRVDLAGIDADNLDIVEEHRRTVSEIQHHGALLA